MTVASAGIASSGMNDKLFPVRHLPSSVLWARQLFHSRQEGRQAFIPVSIFLHPNAFPTGEFIDFDMFKIPPKQQQHKHTHKDITILVPAVRVNK